MVLEKEWVEGKVVKYILVSFLSGLGDSRIGLLNLDRINRIQESLNLDGEKVTFSFPPLTKS